MIRKLKIKFVCINMTLVTLMLIVILGLVVQFTDRSLEKARIQDLEAIASKPLYLLRPGNPSAMGSPYFTLQLNQKGDILESYSGIYDLTDHGLLNELVKGTQTFTTKTGILSDYQLRFLRVSTPSGQFLIFTDISDDLATLENLSRNCLLVGFLSFLCFLIISIFLANWAVQPVEKAWKEQRQFITDASHELKTPLTVILTNAELLKTQQTDSNLDSQTESAQFTDNILLMAGQMKNLVERLLELSHIDRHSIKSIMKPVNFSELLELSLCQFEPLYYEADLSCQTAITPNLRVQGSPSHLKQAIDILLDNGLKYAVSPSEIQISLMQIKGNLLFSISTEGETISQDDLKNIFKRFYRTDKSRQNSGSYGLGLAIAKNIIKEHNGKIWAESHNEKNTFYIRLNLI